MKDDKKWRRHKEGICIKCVNHKKDLNIHLIWRKIYNTSFNCISTVFTLIYLLGGDRPWPHVEVRGQLAGVTSPLLSCGSQGLNSSPQASQQVPLDAESSVGPPQFFKNGF